MTPERFRQVQDLFLQAVDVDAAQRMEWLERHCGGNESLREQVKSLLEHDDTQTLMGAPPEDPAESAARQTVNPRASRHERKSRIFSLLRTFSPRMRLVAGALAVMLPVLVSGWIADRVLDRFKKQLRATALNQAVDAKASAVRFWLSRELTVVQSWADSGRVRQLIGDLVKIAATAPEDGLSDSLKDANSQMALGQELESLARRPLRYAVWDARRVTIAVAAPDRARLASGVTAEGLRHLDAVFEGRADAFVIDSRHPIIEGRLNLPGESSLAMLVPVTNAKGDVIAALLAYHTGTEEELGEFIQLSSSAGRSDIEASTLVFDRSGLLLYDSPYDKQLRSLGLIDRDPQSRSGRRLVLRDPGVDLTSTPPPENASVAKPLTKMVQMAVSHGAGFDVDGYRDVRGVTVAGAWRWLEDYQFGIGIEIDKEAVEPVVHLAQLQSWALLTVLGISIGIAGYAMVSIRRLRTQLASEHRIGPYLLDRKVGEGGMGQVYLARHELLKRPTAIKLLKPEVINETTTARFQHEAQLAARLEHPNTVNVYDFGVTEGGEYYMVMEWIEGLNLDQIVAREGALPVERSIGILHQVAHSLREAHGLGLIHRDLKPQNVMVTQRAGETDVVKVLDFGLAWDLFHRQPAPASTPRMIAGSPRYMAPERWDPTLPAGPSTDLYAFGCVAYFILTGTHAVEGATLEAICQNVLSGKLKRPSAKRVKIPTWIDDLVIQCMAKDVSQRPSSFDEVVKTFRKFASHAASSPP
ncbi:MAG: serine/threonine-protein kinase [Planctomycetaceae bacterium]